MDKLELHKEFIWYLRRLYKSDKMCSKRDLAEMGRLLLHMLTSSNERQEACDELEKNPIYSVDEVTGEWDKLPPCKRDE